jgi:hypothetical protein
MARTALECALAAWDRGGIATLALDESTTVAVIDKDRRTDQKLTGYRILGQVSIEGGRWFEVELQYDQSAKTEHAYYCVIGINPLWVFRQADYEQLAHWDHPMPADPATP